MDQGVLTPPAPLQACPNFPVVQYDDDTLIVMQACAKQLFSLKGILNTFIESTGLKVNFDKSQMIPVNVLQTKMEILPRTFGCQQGSLLFTYLGLPLGTCKPKILDFFPLIQRIDRRLTGYATYLSIGGRLTMVNSIFSHLPTFYMCSLLERFVEWKLALSTTSRVVLVCQIRPQFNCLSQASGRIFILSISSTAFRSSSWPVSTSATIYSRPWANDSGGFLVLHLELNSFLISQSLPTAHGLTSSTSFLQLALGKYLPKAPQSFLLAPPQR